MRKLATILIYYRQIAFISLIFSVLACLIVYNYGWSLFIVAFWFKMLSIATLFYINNRLRENEIYFYYNMGVSLRLLYGVITLLDTTLFILLLVLFFKPHT